MNICAFAHLLLALTPLPTDGVGDVAMWYAEKYRGDLAEAADRHARVYVGRPPWQGKTAAERDHAALRAGLCYEQLGLPQEAVLAYDRLRASAPSPELVALARLRLQRLSEIYPDLRSTAGSMRREASGENERRRATLVRQTVEEAIEAVRRQVSRAGTSLARLERSHSSAERRLQSALVLRADLERRGTIETYPGDFQPDEGFEQRLRQALGLVTSGLTDFEALPTVLSDALCARGLHAVGKGDTDSGRRLLGGCLVLDQEHAAARRVRDRLQAGGAPHALAALARRALVEERLRLLSELIAEVGPLLEKASSIQERVPRPDLAMMWLSQVEEALSWAAPEIRDDAEVRELDRRAHYLSEISASAAPEREALRNWWEVRRIQVRMVVDMAVEVAEAEVGRLGVGDVLAGFDRDRWGWVIHEEAQARLAGARGRLGLKDPDGARTFLDQVDVLTQWVPWLDPDATYRRTARLLRAKLEALELPEPGQ